MAYDYGQVQIAEFKRGAKAGEIRFDEAVVRAVVAELDKVLSMLNATLNTVGITTRIEGFGGFPTGEQMRRGFQTKGHDAREKIVQQVRGCLELQECFLHAAQLFKEAEAKNKQTLLTLTRLLEGHK